MPLSSTERLNFDSRFTALRKINPQNIIPSVERHSHNITEVSIGGIIKLDRKNYLVTASALYTEVNGKWEKKKNPYTVTELTLFCLEDGSTNYLEWSRDDEIEIYFSDRKIPKNELADRLKYDDSEVVDLDDTDDICEEKETLFFNGESFVYDDDCDMVFESSDGRKSFVSSAEFDGCNGSWLTIEGWTNTPRDDNSWEYEVWLSKEVPAGAIEIIYLKGDINAA